MAKTKKKPNMDQLVQSAQETPSTDSNPKSVDPKVKRRITVTIDELIACPFNPRTQRNPKHDEIKASILERGLDHPPNITRENPSDKYMIKDGGNTRLAVLKELWQETKDERFYNINATFHPWTSTSDLLVGHLIENDLRGDILFIERAVAAVELRKSLEESTGEQPSIRDTAKQFSKLGWTIDHSSLALLFYAHEKLFPFAPTAFWAGMGTSKVKELRKIYVSFSKYCKSLDILEEELDRCWVAALKDNDKEDFVIADVMEHTSSALAKHLDTYGHLINQEVYGIMRGAEPTGKVSTRVDEETQQATSYSGATNDTDTTLAQQGTNTGLAQQSEKPSKDGATVLPMTTTKGEGYGTYDWVLKQRENIFKMSQQLLSGVGLDPSISESTPDTYYGYRLNSDALNNTCQVITGKSKSADSENQLFVLAALYGLCGDEPGDCDKANDNAPTVQNESLHLQPQLWRKAYDQRTNPLLAKTSTKLNLDKLEGFITTLRSFLFEEFGNDQLLKQPEIWQSQETFDDKRGAIKEQQQQVH